MDDVIDGTGNMPGSVVAQGFTTLSPLTTVTKYANLIEGMWSDDFLQAHQLMTGWVRTTSPSRAQQCARSRTSSSARTP